MNWIIENRGTLIVGLFVLAIVGAIIANLIKKKRNGESSCGCGTSCSGCGMHGSCHKK